MERPFVSPSLILWALISCRRRFAAKDFRYYALRQTTRQKDILDLANKHSVYVLQTRLALPAARFQMVTHTCGGLSVMKRIEQPLRNTSF